MKKLGKLSINPEKVIKNEELMHLRGGYDGECSDGLIPCICNQFFACVKDLQECWDKC
jgi:hypothetical protein